MRNYLDVKNLHAKIGEPVREAAEDARAAAQAIGRAAESQARLNIALTGVCVAALLVAVLLTRGAREAGR